VPNLILICSKLWPCIRNKETDIDRSTDRFSFIYIRLLRSFACSKEASHVLISSVNELCQTNHLAVLVLVALGTHHIKLMITFVYGLFIDFKIVTITAIIY